MGFESSLSAKVLELRQDFLHLSYTSLIKPSYFQKLFPCPWDSTHHPEKREGSVQLIPCEAAMQEYIICGSLSSRKRLHQFRDIYEISLSCAG